MEESWEEGINCQLSRLPARIEPVFDTWNRILAFRKLSPAQQKICDLA